jgi:hypothetical protein
MTFWAWKFALIVTRKSLNTWRRMISLCWQPKMHQNPRVNMNSRIRNSLYLSSGHSVQMFGAIFCIN